MRPIAHAAALLLLEEGPNVAETVLVQGYAYRFTLAHQFAGNKTMVEVDAYVVEFGFDEASGMVKAVKLAGQTMPAFALKDNSATAKADWHAARRKWLDEFCNWAPVETIRGAVRKRDWPVCSGGALGYEKGVA